MRVLKVITLFAAVLLVPGSLKAQEIPLIDPRADQLLQDFSDYLESAEQFTFQAETTVDEFSPRGQKVQYSHLIEIATRRPDGLRMNQTGDLLNRSFWFDGNTISILEQPLNLYASIASPRSIDELIDYIYDEFGVSAPLADFVVSNPYESVISNVQTGDYLGLHQVREKQCHHLAFTQANIDWQIWIEDGPQIVACKLVITYKTLPDSPQYTAYFFDWDFDSRLSDRFFRFEVPDGGTEIELLTRE